METIAEKTTGNNRVIFIPQKLTSIGDYYATLIAAGHSPEFARDVIAGLRDSGLYS